MGQSLLQYSLYEKLVYAVSPCLLLGAMPPGNLGPTGEICGSSIYVSPGRVVRDRPNELRNYRRQGGMQGLGGICLGAAVSAPARLSLDLIRLRAYEYERPIVLPGRPASLCRCRTVVAHHDLGSACAVVYEECPSCLRPFAYRFFPTVIGAGQRDKDVRRYLWSHEARPAFSVRLGRSP
jgi:hypothetical protein